MTFENQTRIIMSKAKKKPYLNRKKTQTLLTTLKAVTTAGALSLTLTGWGILADLDARHVAQAAAAPVAVANQPATVASKATAVAPRQRIKLRIVQWVQNAAGDRVAVVQDKRGALWYVMGSDVPRLEQGQPPRVQPQLVRVTTRTRAS
jgi:hypothetical protein